MARLLTRFSTFLHEATASDMLGLITPGGALLMKAVRDAREATHKDVFGSAAAAGSLDTHFRYDHELHLLRFDDTPSRETYFRVMDGLAKKHLEVQLVKTWMSVSSTTPELYLNRLSESRRVFPLVLR